MGIVTVLLSKEPQVAVPRETAQREQAAAARLHPRLLAWLYAAVASPFLDFVLRYRWNALLLLALIGTYRISDIVLGVISYPFYCDMGFTKDEVAAVSGVYGVLMTLACAALGGVLALRYGVLHILMLGAALSALTNLLFAWLATRGHKGLGRAVARTLFVACAMAELMLLALLWFEARAALGTVPEESDTDY